MRLVQLTALAYIIGFVTDVFDDGASAETAHDVYFANDEASADLDSGSRGGRERSTGSIVDALAPVPAAAIPPLKSELIDADHDGEFGREAARQLLPRQCIHGVTDKRPKLTRNEQRRTASILAHVIRRLKADDGLHKLLQLVAMRESSMQQGLVHRLTPDLEASISAWRKTAKLYEGNPHYADPAKWQTYGIFGMNSNYFTLVWDNQSDPQVLCDAIVDVLVYRRAAARVVRKAGAPIRCVDDQGNTFDYTTKATWETIHRAVSGGKLCPSKSENFAAIMGKYFRGRAAKVGLDPDQPVNLKMLGVEPNRSLDGDTWDTQDKMLAGLWAEIEAEWQKHPLSDDPAPTKIARRKPK